MKITIEIPDDKAGAIIDRVAWLIAATKPVDATVDQATGHQKLPLSVMDSADQIRVTSNAMVEDTLPALIPVPGRRYKTREGNVTVASQIVQPHDRILTFVCGEFDLPFYYERNGLPCGGCGPEWEIVEDLGPVTL